MTSHKRTLFEALRNLFGSRSEQPEEGAPGRTDTQLRPSGTAPAAPSPQNGPEPPSPASATARKPEPGSGEPSVLEDTHESWTAKTCPIHQTGDLIEGRYEVKERFEGAMGYVYIARDTTQDLTFAIKQPKAQMLATRDFFARVLREADAWTGLGMHPHIAYCYFVKSLEGVPHIFVEYVDGGNLRDWIAEGRCPDERARLELAIQFCHGMEHAHGRGMIHRDIKPENILVTAQGTVKVTDFGLVGEAAGRTVAVPAGGTATGTRFGDLMGTPAYMAPEQIADPRRRSAEVPDGVGTDSDVYSFGICLWELFCGGHPDQFESTGAAAIQRARPDLPAGLGELLLSTVATERTERPTDFTALRERLNGIYRELFQEDAPSYRIEVPESAADELNNQGYSYFELGKPQEARACFERARDIEPTHPQATNNLSLLQWRAGEIDDLEVLRRLENCRQNPEVEKQTLAELTAFVHAERFAPDLAREVLKEYPDRYEALFGGAVIGEIQCFRTLNGHAKPVETVALSADGRWALSGSRDKTVKFWDLATGRCRHTLEGHNSWVGAVALSADGRRALSGGGDTSAKDYALRVWDLETGVCLRTLAGHTMTVNAVAMSADGRLAVSGSWDETLKFWDLETGVCLRTLSGHTKSVEAVALSADGRRAVSGSDDSTIKLWDMETGNCLRTLEGHNATVALSADYRWALWASPDGTLKLWNLETGTCLLTLDGHTEPARAAALSADGRRAVSGSNDRTVKLWDLETTECFRTLEGHTHYVSAVALSADGSWVLSGSWDKTVRLWELAPRARYAARCQLAIPKGIQYRDREKQALDEAMNDAETTLAMGDCRGAYHRLFSAWQAVSFRESARTSALYTSLLRRGSPSRPTLAYQAKVLEGHSNGVNAVALSADGRLAVSGGWDHTLKLWTLETGTCLGTLEGHTSSISSIALSADGRWAVSGSWDKTLKFWDLGKGACLQTLVGHTSVVNSVALSADARRVLSGSDDHTLKLWDLEVGACLRTLKGHHDVQSVALSADGRWAVSGGGHGPFSSGYAVRLWDLETATCLGTLDGHSDTVTAVALSGDAARALSGSDDNTLRLWDTETRVCLRTLNRGGSAMTLSADTRWALSGRYNGSLDLWDLKTGANLCTLKAHTSVVNAVTLSADGQWAVSGGADRTVRLWRIIWELEFPERAA